MLPSSQEELPLCHGCLRPHSPLLHYCPHCGTTVGQFTPNIPFVNIGYQCEFWGRLWRRLWQPDGGVFVRLVGAIMILHFVPILLIGLPFVLLTLIRRRKERQGFDVLVDAENATTAPSPSTTSREENPTYEHRPRVEHRR